MNRTKLVHRSVGALLSVVVFAIASCGADSNENGATPPEDTGAETEVVETPSNFPVEFPEGGEVATLDDPTNQSVIRSVVVIYPDGDLADLTSAMRSQLPSDVAVTSTDKQTSLVSAQVIINVSEQPDGVWISVSTL